MRDPPLGLLGRLSKGEAKVDGEEHRVVAEPVAPPRLVGERAEALAPSGHRLRLRAGQSGDAHVAHPPVIWRSSGDLVEQPAYAVRVGGALPAPACRERPGPA